MYRLFCRLHFPTQLDWTPADLQDSNIKHGNTMITTSCCIYSGRKKCSTRLLSPTTNYCGCHDVGFSRYTSFCRPALQIRSTPSSVAFSMGWLKHFPKVKVSKASGNATFSKLRLKETPKVMCCKPLLIFADMIRDDDDFVLTEGGTTWKWKTKLNC